MRRMTDLEYASTLFTWRISGIAFIVGIVALVAFTLFGMIFGEFGLRESLEMEACILYAGVVHLVSYELIRRENEQNNEVEETKEEENR